MATRRLADAARNLGVAVATQMGPADGLSDADKARLVSAFEALAHEMDVRTGAAPRGRRAGPVDPMQEMLFNDGLPGGVDHGQQETARR